MSNLTDEDFKSIGTKGLENATKDDFKNIEFKLDIEHSSGLEEEEIFHLGDYIQFR